ncbi:MAG: PEP-CTERM sorting domain-containing protein [Alphaproteobacteria bacterium]
MKRHIAAGLIALMGLALSVDRAEAVIIGITGAATTEAASIVTANGDTPVILATVDAASLAGVDVLWALNESNGTQLASLVGNADLAAFVNAGGVFLYHDREVDDAETVLPGGAGFNVIRDFSDDANIEIVDSGTLVTNGPAGIISGTDLDGGNSSSHGFTVAGSLPGGTTIILSRTDPNQVVDFIYSLGAGRVYYSTIPLDFYLQGGGSVAVNANFQRYGQNVVAFAASNAQAVPEPGALLVFGSGFSFLGLILARRRAREADHHAVNGSTA